MKNLIFLWLAAAFMLIETAFLLYCYYHIVTILLVAIALMAVGYAVSITADYINNRKRK